METADADDFHGNGVIREISKKPRKRKKQIYNMIRKQMEFYFGDANLAKDRYLKQLIAENPNVPLTEFMKFNKIKTLANSTDDIVKALTNSEMLELSVDQTTVRRITDIIERSNIDECTIYVEALPTTATHEWVRNIFEAYGTIVYVSLPKYKSSRQIKEFAFVEYENKTGVIKAMNAFTQLGRILNMDTNSETLCSITSYLKEQEPDTAENPMVENPLDDDVDDQEISGSVDEQSDAATVSETMGDLTDASDADSVPYGGIVKRCKFDTENTEHSAATVTIVNESNEAEMTNSRKKIRRKKTTAKHKNKNEEKPENSIETLRVITKLEWKRLRNKYLNHQRDKLKEIKKQLWTERKLIRPPPPPPQKKRSIVRNPRNINFYGAMKESKEDDVETYIMNKTLTKKPLFTYEPGIIVKVLFDVPCIDVKEFKTEMRQYQYVKYVDVKEGDMAAYVRVDVPRSTPTLIKHCAPHRCQILTGENEHLYWEKINNDREQKISKTLKVKSQRGREKVIKKSAIHTRFDE